MPRKMPEHIFGYSYLLSRKIRIQPSPFMSIWHLSSSVMMWAQIFANIGNGSSSISSWYTARYVPGSRERESSGSPPNSSHACIGHRTLWIDVCVHISSSQSMPIMISINSHLLNSFVIVLYIFLIFWLLSYCPRNRQHLGYRISKAEIHVNNTCTAELPPVAHVIIFVTLVFAATSVVSVTYPHGSALWIRQAEKLSSLDVL